MSKKKILAILTGTATVATAIAAYEAKKKADKTTYEANLIEPIKKRKRGIYEKYIKRALDVICATGAIVVFSPVYLGVAVLVKLKLGSPVLFTQDRPGLIGKDGRETVFKMYKFRTMTDERDENGELLPDEARLTKFGKWLRNTSLDELPEAFNILNGTMSVIGPRPQLVRDMAAQYVLEDMARIPVRVELASEFRYRSMAINRNALVIAISQSGETADTLAALRLAKEKGMTTLAIVNVVGSSIAREADKVFYTLAGPEISVATTKAYSAQLAAMYCIAVEFALVRGKITEEQYAYYISELLTIAPKINKILEDKERLQWFAAKYAGAHDVFFVGRGIDYAVSLEGSLKLKEISYIHSEAYAAGELKHGTISLIEPGTLVIGVLTQSKLYEKTMSNMVECRSRGAYLLGLTTYGKYEIEETVDFAVYVPRIDEYFAGSLAVVPLQLLGYYVSVAKGLDVDKPRNLAKSVTVE